MRILHADDFFADLNALSRAAWLLGGHPVKDFWPAA